MFFVPKSGFGNKYNLFNFGYRDYTSVVDSSTLNQDPDPIFWPWNLDPDPGLCCQLIKFKINFRKQFIGKIKKFITTIIVWHWKIFVVS